MARTQAAVSARLLEEWHELEAAVAVILCVWGDAAVSLASPALLRTYSHYGNPVLGAFDGEHLCGVSIGFLASEPEVHLHSHITGVLPSHQHLGVGYELKMTQRRWCAARGIDLVTWTFDPMLARNAHFNLRKLGARARRLLPSFYGAMDDDINRGDETDRLEVRWELGDDHDERRPVVHTVPIPGDYLALRHDDPGAATKTRATVREALLAGFAEGLEVVDFSRDEGYGLAPVACVASGSRDEFRAADPSEGVDGRPRRTMTAPTALRSGGVSTGHDVIAGSLERELESHRRELTGYCYRMLGSGFEAEDAVQETLIRAWRNIDGFEGRSSMRSWLYRIATNVCVDMQRGPQRRARPMDLGPSSSSNGVLDGGLADNSWVLPVQDARVLPTDSDPATLVEGRESIRLAFVAALQHLPPRQRAVLILREVLRWQATEVAELLETTVASVNSALQRARASLDGLDLAATGPTRVDADQQALLDRYVAAFERYDVEALVALIHEDAVQTMPPYAFWIQGRDNIGAWFLGQGIGCKGARLVSAGMVNGLPAFGNYRVAGPGVWKPFGIQLLEVSDGTIVGFHNFLYPELFEAFGLPAQLEG